MKKYIKIFPSHCVFWGLLLHKKSRLAGNNKAKIAVDRSSKSLNAKIGPGFRFRQARISESPYSMICNLDGHLMIDLSNRDSTRAKFYLINELPCLDGAFFKFSGFVLGFVLGFVFNKLGFQSLLIQWYVNWTAIWWSIYLTVIQQEQSIT